MDSNLENESSDNIIKNIDAAKDKDEKELNELKEPKKLSLEERINIEVGKKGELDPKKKIEAEIEFIKKEINSITSEHFDDLNWTAGLQKKYEEIRDIILTKQDEIEDKGIEYDDVKEKISKLKNLNAEKYTKINRNKAGDLRRNYLGGKKSRKFKRKTKKGKRSRKARKSRRKSNRRRGRR